MRRAGRLGLVLLLATPTLLLAPGAQAQGEKRTTARGNQTSPSAEPAPEAQPEQTGLLTITDIRPRSPRPGDPFQVIGTIKNTSDRPIRSVKAQILRGTRILSRGGLANADAAEEINYGRRLAPVALPGGDEIAPGATVKLDLRTTVDNLRMSALYNGVYPIAIRVTGVAEDGSALDLDEARSYLPWFQDKSVSRIRLAWLVPVVDQPRLSPAAPTPKSNSGRPAEQMVDNELDTLLGRRGRLGSLLTATRQNPTCAAPEPLVAEGQDEPVIPPERAPAACTPTPVTFAVDPDLLDSAETMTGPYEVRTNQSASSVTREGASAAATSFLTALRAAAGGRDDILSLPFADTDVTALAGSALDAQIDDAEKLGREITTRLLGSPLESVKLAPPGPVTDPAALDAFSDTDTRAVVLDPTALIEEEPRNGEGTFTRDTRFPLNSNPSGLSGLFVDDALSRLLVSEPEVGGQAAPRLLQQRWLVETAMIAAERPNDPRTILVELPRRDPVDPSRIRAALADTGRLPWMCAVTLDDVAKGTEACAGEVSHDEGRNPDGAPAPDPLQRVGVLAGVNDPALSDKDSLRRLSGSVLDEVAAERDRADRFTSGILAAGSTEAASTRKRLQKEVLRALSTAWRTAPKDGEVLVQRLQDDLDATFAKVSLRAGKVLLTSKNSRLEVTVTNSLDQPIQVLAQLKVPTDGRLTTDPAKLVTVPGGSTVPVVFGAETASPGRFVVTARLLDNRPDPGLTEEDRVFAQEPLQVRSTRYGTLALALTGIAAAFLLVAAGVRVTRRALGAGQRRRARA